MPEGSDSILNYLQAAGVVGIVGVVVLLITWFHVIPSRNKKSDAEIDRESRRADLENEREKQRIVIDATESTSRIAMMDAVRVSVQQSADSQHQMAATMDRMGERVDETHKGIVELLSRTPPIGERKPN